MTETSSNKSLVTRLRNAGAAAKSAFSGIGNAGDGLFRPPAHYPVDYWQRGWAVRGNEGCATVEACVAAYAQTAAALPTQHVRVSDSGEHEVQPRSAAAIVLRKPNAYQTRSDFFLNLIRGLMSEGNGYAIGIRDERRAISEMHLVDPRAVSVLIGEDGDVFYEITQHAFLKAVDADKLMVPARDMMHIRLFTPSHPLVGVTPIHAAAASISANQSISAQQSAFFQNMSRPSGVLTTDQTLNAEQNRALRAVWEEQSAQLNSGRTPILSQGLKWQNLSINSQDAQLVDAFNMTVVDIARAFRVPLPLVNIMEGATFSNTENLMSFWLASGLGFLLEHLEASLNAFLGLPPGELIDFDTNRLLRTDFAAKVNALGSAVTHGLLSPNEGRAMLGHGRVEGGKMPRLQAQLIPLDYEPDVNQPATAPGAAPEPVAEEEPVPTEPDGQPAEMSMLASITKLLDDKLTAAEEAREAKAEAARIQAEKDKAYEIKAAQEAADLRKAEQVVEAAHRKTTVDKSVAPADRKTAYLNLLTKRLNHAG